MSTGPQQVEADAFDLLTADTSGWVCDGCACSDLDACETADGHCHWVAPCLCSACEGS